MTYSRGTVVKWQKRGKKVDSKSSQLCAVSTWMGDLIRIPTEGFDFYSFFFFFSVFIYFFIFSS